MLKAVRVFLISLLLLASVLVSPSNFLPTSAYGTIYIRANGAVDPPTAPIMNTDNMLYKLTDNIYDSIEIERNSIILDGNGYTLESPSPGSGFGLYLFDRANVTVRNMNIREFMDGIVLYLSNTIRIVQSTISNNAVAILLGMSGNNSISANTIANNSECGICSNESFCNSLYDNSFSDNQNGILLFADNYTNIYRNTVINNNVGINLMAAYSDRIFHNNVINNTVQAQADSEAWWDDHYPSGGNYWSDYTGSDLYCGEFQNETGVDEIGDTAHPVSGMGQDNYPLMQPVQARASGPRMDGLSIRYCADADALYSALVNGEVELTNYHLNSHQMHELFSTIDIQTAVYPSLSLNQFDLNNNATTPAYPSYRNPTAFKEFRQAIAYLANKTQILEAFNFSCRIDTPIPRPYGDEWVDWSSSQYDSYGNMLGNYPYEFNSTLAAQLLEASGFTQGNVTNPYYDPSFPGSSQNLRVHATTGETLDPLKFIVRNDDSARLAAGYMLRDNLLKMGIPVNVTEANHLEAIAMLETGNYHVYTGTWGYEACPPAVGSECLGLYTSDQITPGFSENYVRFTNDTYDEWAMKLQHAVNMSSAKEAALKCQQILLEEAVCVWLCSRCHVMGYRNMYPVTSMIGKGVNNRWTLLQAQTILQTKIRYGLQQVPASLNVVTDYGNEFADPETDILSCIYDSLLSYSPYCPPFGQGKDAMPLMAESWSIETWQSPYAPSENLTKLVFYLREDVTWHDGAEFNSSDVKFTIDYLKDWGNLTPLQGLVADVHHVAAPEAHRVVVYENVSSIWTLNDIGCIPILPKHIFQNISNVTGYTPGADEGHQANNTLIGTGPWKHVYHNSSIVYLKANREYFMEIPPEAEVDFCYDWEVGSWIVDGADATYVARSFGSQGKLIPPANWQSGCDLTGDSQVDTNDWDKILVGFNMTWGESAKRTFPPSLSNAFIYLEPAQTQATIGENITVTVELVNLDRLYGLQFRLDYDCHVLDYVGSSTVQIFDNQTTITNDPAQTPGTVLLSVSSSGLVEAISANATLATMVFNAKSCGSSVLNIWNTKFQKQAVSWSTCILAPHTALDALAIIPVYTPEGADIAVAPARNINVTFSQVTAEGNTTAQEVDPPSLDFTHSICIEIQTTASYAGSIALQFEFDPTGMTLEDEEAMKIWLWEESSQTWLDVTTGVDTYNNVVYGVAPHLSMFGITSALSIEGVMSEAGETTASTPHPMPDPPSGLRWLVCYEIQTSKTYEGLLTLRFDYGPLSEPLLIEQLIRMWRYNETTSVWEDITSEVDTYADIVCGKTHNLSMFGVTGLLPLPDDVAILNAHSSKTIVGHGYNLTVSFTVRNQIGLTETSVVVYRNSTLIELVPVTLGPLADQPFAFTWNTSDWPTGRHVLCAWDHLLSSVKVTVAGDVDGNGLVNMLDLYNIALHYGATSGTPAYIANYDVDGNGIINMLDLYVAAIHFGQTSD